MFICIFSIFEVSIFFKTYPVKYGCPALHCDALEDGQHGEPDVVERGDPEVRPLPLLQADGDVGLAGVSTGWGLGRVVRVARDLARALGHDLV